MKTITHLGYTKKLGLLLLLAAVPSVEAVFDDKGLASALAAALKAPAPPKAAASDSGVNAPIKITVHADLRIEGTNAAVGEFPLGWITLGDGATAPDLAVLTRELKPWTVSKPEAERREVHRQDICMTRVF
jgi:hypothetical protein